MLSAAIKNLSVTAVVTLLFHNFALADTPASSKVIVLDSGEAQLTLIDEANRKVVGTAPTGKEPHHLMATPDNKSLIVANSVSNNLVFLDPKSGHIQRWVENIEKITFSRTLEKSDWNNVTLKRDVAEIFHFKLVAVKTVNFSMGDSPQTQVSFEFGGLVLEFPTFPGGPKTVVISGWDRTKNTNLSDPKAVLGG